MKPAADGEPRPSAQALFTTVLGDRRPRLSVQRWPVYLVAWSAALGVHLCLWLAALGTEPSLETWSARMAALIHEDLATQAPVALAQLPASATDPVPSRKPSSVESAASALPSGQMTPPAQSGRVVATEVDPSPPVDLTDTAIVTGTASAYIGGVSANAGAHLQRAEQGATDPSAVTTATPGRASRARPVQLSGKEWRCDWPASSAAQDMFEQFVVLRVVVRADGSVEQATVLRDPGQGFGAAAVACARRTRFSPARDANGKSVRAVSPPIRVRFTR